MRLLLIDGHYFAYRSFHAIQHLTNSRGEPTNAIYGFVKTVRKMLVDLKPDLAAVIFDGGLPQDRMDLHPEYKAQRSEMPDSLSLQLPQICEIIPALGIAAITVEGEEADDIMACYVGEAAKRGMDVVMATNDKDLMQLVTPSVRIYQSKGNEFQLLGPAEVEEKWGVPPEKIGDILALTGDAVDNIPGVEGVGPKTAANWIRQFGSLDALVQRYAEIKSDRLRQNVANALDVIRRNREMVSLRCHLAVPEPLDSLTIHPRYPELISKLERLEFKTLLNEVRKESEAQQAQSQGDLFA